MAINSTNTIATTLGVDSESQYIRMVFVDKLDGSVDVDYYFYTDKSGFIADEYSFINRSLSADITRSFNTGVLTPADNTIDNKHDLAIAELILRGLDGNKLSKVDLV